MSLTVALRARVAWSRLKPIETMVARCSSGRLSVGVVPGAELEPGNTKGAAKSAENHTQRIITLNLHTALNSLHSWHSLMNAFTRVFHVPHHPVHSSVDASVPASLQRKTHLTQLRHCGVIQHWGWETDRESGLHTSFDRRNIYTDWMLIKIKLKKFNQCLNRSQFSWTEN